MNAIDLFIEIVESREFRDARRRNDKRWGDRTSDMRISKAHRDNRLERRVVKAALRDGDWDAAQFTLPIDRWFWF